MLSNRKKQIINLIYDVIFDKSSTNIKSNISNILRENIRNEYKFYLTNKNDLKTNKEYLNSLNSILFEAAVSNEDKALEQGINQEWKKNYRSKSENANKPYKEMAETYLQEVDKNPDSFIIKCDVANIGSVITNERKKFIKDVLSYFNNNTSYSPQIKAAIVGLLIKKQISYKEESEDPYGNVTPQKFEISDIKRDNSHTGSDFNGAIASKVKDLILQSTDSNFSLEKIYREALKNSVKDSKESRKDKRGWLFLPKGSDPQVLLDLTKGCPGGWCTGTSLATARSHIDKLNMYIYFDNTGTPRIMFSEINGIIVEVSGSFNNQHLRQNEIPIATEKIKELGFSGEIVENIVDDQRKLQKFEKWSKSGKDISEIPSELLTFDEIIIESGAIIRIMKFNTERKHQRYGNEPLFVPKEKDLEKLRPLMFEMFINDLEKLPEKDVKVLADNSSLTDPKVQLEVLKKLPKEDVQYLAKNPSLSSDPEVQLEVLKKLPKEDVQYLARNESLTKDPNVQLEILKKLPKEDVWYLADNSSLTDPKVQLAVLEKLPEEDVWSLADNSSLTDPKVQLAVLEKLPEEDVWYLARELSLTDPKVQLEVLKKLPEKHVQYLACNLSLTDPDVQLAVLEKLPEEDVWYLADNSSLTDPKVKEAIKRKKFQESYINHYDNKNLDFVIEGFGDFLKKQRKIIIPTVIAATGFVYPYYKEKQYFDIRHNPNHQKRHSLFYSGNELPSSSLGNSSAEGLDENEKEIRSIEKEIQSIFLQRSELEMYKGNIFAEINKIKSDRDNTLGNEFNLVEEVLDEKGNVIGKEQRFVTRYEYLNALEANLTDLNFEIHKLINKQNELETKKLINVINRDIKGINLSHIKQYDPMEDINLSEKEKINIQKQIEERFKAIQKINDLKNEYNSQIVHLKKGGEAVDANGLIEDLENQISELEKQLPPKN